MFFTEGAYNGVWAFCLHIIRINCEISINNMWEK